MVTSLTPHLEKGVLVPSPSFSAVKEGCGLCMRACKNVAFDICYWTENLAKTWLISVVVYVRTFHNPAIC